jgi:hypothetical protein
MNTVYAYLFLIGNELVSRQSGKVTFPNSARSDGVGSQRMIKSSASGDCSGQNNN